MGEEQMNLKFWVIIRKKNLRQGIRGGERRVHFR
jgi:hypothetical protein